MLGAMTNMDFIFSNAELHASSNSNLASFSNSLHDGLEIFEKSWMNLLLNLACPRKLLITFTIVGGIKVFIKEILA